MSRRCRSKLASSVVFCVLLLIPLASTAFARDHIERALEISEQMDRLSKERATLAERWDNGPPIFLSENDSWIEWRGRLEEWVTAARRVADRLHGVARESHELLEERILVSATGLVVGSEGEFLEGQLEALRLERTNQENRVHVLELVAAGALDRARELALTLGNSDFLDTFLATHGDERAVHEAQLRVAASRTFAASTAEVEGRLAKGQAQLAPHFRTALRQFLVGASGLLEESASDQEHWARVIDQLARYGDLLAIPAFAPLAPAEKVEWEWYLDLLDAQLTTTLVVEDELEVMGAVGPVLLPEGWSERRASVVVGTRTDTTRPPGRSDRHKVAFPELRALTLACSPDQVCFLHWPESRVLLGLVEQGAEVTLGKGPLTQAPLGNGAESLERGVSFSAAYSSCLASMRSSPGVLMGFPAASDLAQELAAATARLDSAQGGHNPLAVLTAQGPIGPIGKLAYPASGHLNWIGNLEEWALDITRSDSGKRERFAQSVGFLGGSYRSGEDDISFRQSSPWETSEAVGFRPVVALFSDPRRVDFFAVSTLRPEHVNELVLAIERHIGTTHYKLEVLDWFDVSCPAGLHNAFRNGVAEYRQRLTARTQADAAARVSFQGRPAEDLYVELYSFKYEHRSSPRDEPVSGEISVVVRDGAAGSHEIPLTRRSGELVGW